MGAQFDVTDGQIHAMRHLILLCCGEVFRRVVERLEAVARLAVAQERDGLFEEVQRVDEDNFDCTAHGACLAVSHSVTFV